MGLWKRKKRKKRRPGWSPPTLTEEQILAWADRYHDTHGVWPRKDSGAIQWTWERWSAIDGALWKGLRGLQGGSSLPRLLAARRGVRNRKGLPHYTIPQILEWADAFHARTGEWPVLKTRPNGIPGTNGETWTAVDCALRSGMRGLPGGSSLAQLLAKHRKVRNRRALPPLTVKRVLAWADAFHQRTGDWPKAKNWPEEIPDSGGETWAGVIQALAGRWRGYSGTQSLFDLLERHRGVRYTNRLPTLSEKQIRRWADAYRQAHGKWPAVRCPQQTIPGTSGETWFNVDQALRKGLRGLPGGSSLHRLLN